MQNDPRRRTKQSSFFVRAASGDFVDRFCPSVRTAKANREDTILAPAASSWTTPSIDPPAAVFTPIAVLPRFVQAKAVARYRSAVSPQSPVYSDRERVD